MSAASQSRLVYMANQIARNFAAQGEKAAIAQTAEHIRLFWNPRMIKEAIEAEPDKFDPIAKAAIIALSSE